MGAASSSNNNGVRRSPSLISTSEAETSSTYTRDARLATNDNGRQRTRVGTSVYNGEDEPRSQGPSPYATLRADEFWDRRPTAPSPSGTLPSKRETLLTYAAQMTGWQSADGHGIPTCQQSNEIMELSRIISQLAMANHQLASAHNATLTRMEMLYLELSKERENRKRTVVPEVVRDDSLTRRLREYTEEYIETEETRGLEQRVIRLENLLAASSAARQYSKQQRDTQSDNRLRSRIERLENLLRTQGETKGEDDDDLTARDSRESRCDSPEQRTTSISIAIDAAVPEDEDQDATTEACCAACSDNEEMTDDVGRIDDTRRSTNVDLDRTRRRRRARLRDDEEVPTRISAGEEEILRFTEEIDRLKADRIERQSANERLLSSLTDQKNLVEKLNDDYEELKARYVTVEANSRERRQRYDELTEHLASAKKEIGRLLREIDILRSDKDTADARISILEQDLQKSLHEKEQIRNAESQTASRLRAQLSEEVSDKKRQIKALEDALQEIQRLKETIKTERRNENDAASTEDIDIIDSIDDVEESTSEPHRAATSMEEFKKDLTLKREARQRAIAAISSEMERLRRDLDAEREAHSKTSSMLALLRSVRRADSQDLASDDCIRSTTDEQEERKNSEESEKASRRSEALRLTNTLKVSDELRNDIRYQIEKVDDLRYHLETDPERHRHRIRCLTEVTNKARESLKARERQTNELKNYLAQVLVRLGNRSFLEAADETGAECSRQLENVNALKGLYNERLRVLSELRDTAIKELMDVKQRLEYSLKKSQNLEEELRKADEKVDTQSSEITNLESQLGLTKADCRDLQNQMSLINGLFTQMLLGASSADMDLDRLTQLLQENHDLISDIAREESTEAAALPKLLLDLVEQVEGGKASQRQANGENNVESNGETDRKEDDLQEENIAHNLPKVWRVLLELLSCHAVTSPSVSVASCSDPNSCYKSVDTPAGPTLVISVSKTYIRLKELILEKKHLEKEMNRMKQLNTHLESKLAEQEKRLSMVSVELSKTWNIVGRMQAQHQQLHTHEEILRYELQQKRKMLQELKQELEYCREKWESARQKNTNTELEWRNLRREFAARKALAVHDSFNNSAESGFSDGRGDDTDEEEEGTIEGRIRHGPRRRTRKESPRAPTPDTESEQPTDTELSESKTGSSETLEQRTPTPETEAELDEIEVADVDSESVADVDHESTQESMDPLDQALSNVIQNLIRMDDGESSKSVSISSEDKMSSEDSCDGLNVDISDDNASTIKMDSCCQNPRSWTPSIEPWCSSSSKTLKRTSTSIDLPSAVDNGESTESLSITAESSSNSHVDDDGETMKSENIITPSSVSHVSIASTTNNTTSTMPIFSIGPFPTPTVPLSSIKSVQFSNPLIVGPSNRFLVPVFGTTATELANSADSCVASSSIALSLSMVPSSQGEETKEQLISSKPIENIKDSDSVSVDSSSSLDTVREFPTDLVLQISPATSSTSPSGKEEPQETATSSQKEATTKSRTPEEVLAARADRLKRLEEQADWLVKKMNATSKRGSALCTRLEELHEAYSEPPVPPPMPDVLPSRRLPSSLPDLPRQISESSSAGGTENTQGESSDAAKDDASPSNTSAP